ncbi:MAG: GspH/FimT family protein [Legionellaceae bacterium]|nr:GspH/FimT family protein [Legionellaceae bacterium]
MANIPLATFHYARLEAIRPGQQVSICPAASAALNSCGQTGQWNQGGVVFLVRNNDNLQHSNDELTKLHEAVPTGILVQVDRDMVSYDGAGFVTTDPMNMLISATGCNRENARNFNLSDSGRLNIARTACL